MEKKTISLTKLGRGRPREWEVKSVSEVPLSIGAKEGKRFIALDAREHILKLVERKMGHYGPDLIGLDISSGLRDSADYYIRAWEILKRRGFPVVDTVRKVTDMSVAITDLTANGWGVYDAKLDRRRDRKSLSMDRDFADISIEEIRVAVSLILEDANKRGIGLSKDGAMHLIVNDPGKWRLLLLDISEIIIYSDPAEMSSWVRNQNKECIENWLKNMQEIQETIRNKPTTPKIVQERERTKSK